ncbi:STAS domain-containing protein, partial [Actinocorallia lasiicapitis]
SRLAALTHALVLAGIVLVAAPLVGRIPLAALVGVLLATAVRIVEAGSRLALARSTRSDGIVMVLTAAATLALDLVKAVILGMVIAGALALRSIARATRLQQVALDPADHHAEEHELLADHIVAYRLDGPLFFGAAHRFLLELTEIADVRVVILRMSRISTLDATGAHVLGDAITRLEHRGILVLLSGIKPGHDQVLATLGVADHLRDQGLIFPGTPHAIAHARDHLRATGHLPALTGRP